MKRADSFCPFSYPINICMTAQQEIDRIVGFTLVDITATGVTRATHGNEYERNQQRNWETVKQLMGLRTQPHVIQGPEQVFMDVSDLFGDMYTGEHAVWIWEFRVDHPSVFTVGKEAIGGLLLDFENIPIITGLDETARFMLPVFHPHGAIKNIHFISFPNE